MYLASCLSIDMSLQRHPPEGSVPAAVLSRSGYLARKEFCSNRALGGTLQTPWPTNTDISHVGGCQDYGPLLGPLNTRGRIILRTQKRVMCSTSAGSSHSRARCCGCSSESPSPLRAPSQPLAACVSASNFSVFWPLFSSTVTASAVSFNNRLELCGVFPLRHIPHRPNLRKLNLSCHYRDISQTMMKNSY